jgi:hypothetical protein
MESVNAQRAAEANVFPLPTTLNVLREARAVGIVGSQNYPEPARTAELVRWLHPEAIVVSGGTIGIDESARIHAVHQEHPVVELHPMGSNRHAWTQAAFKRNEWIAFITDIVVAFWDGQSHGTKSTIEAALKLKGLVIVALPGEDPEIWVPKIQ